MRGTDEVSGSLFSYVDLDERIPAAHPLRKIRQIGTTRWRAWMPSSTRSTRRMGRPSIAPERLIRASLLQMLFSIRSERQLMEQMDYNLLFRWFVGLGIDDPVWVPTVFTKNRDRLLTTDMSRKVMAAILASRGPATAVGRALLRRRHAGQGMGIHEELPAKGERTAGSRRRPRRPATAATGRRDLPRHRPEVPADRDPADARHAPPAPQRRSELPGREALERDPCLGHGPRCAAPARPRHSTSRAVAHDPSFCRCSLSPPHAGPGWCSTGAFRRCCTACRATCSASCPATC